MTTSPTSPRTAFFLWLFLLGLLGFCCTLGIKWMKWPGGSPLLVITGLLTIVGSFVQIGRGSEIRTDREFPAPTDPAAAASVITMIPCTWFGITRTCLPAGRRIVHHHGHVFGYGIPTPLDDAARTGAGHIELFERRGAPHEA